MKPKIYVGVIIVFVIALVVLALKQQGAGSHQVSTEGKVKGSLSAPVQIVEFSDFQCPACKAVQPVLSELLKKYPDKIAVTFKHFPLSGHLWASVAHQSAECAARQNKFWEFHDKLYDNQESWSGPKNPLETFLRYAGELELNMDTFGTCLSDATVAADIQLEKTEGTKLKVSSTPSLFIGEERFVGAPQLATKGEAYIREKLGLAAEAPKVEVTTTDEHAGHNH